MGNQVKHAPDWDYRTRTNKHSVRSKCQVLCRLKTWRRGYLKISTGPRRHVCVIRGSCLALLLGNPRTMASKLVHLTGGGSRRGGGGGSRRHPPPPQKLIDFDFFFPFCIRMLQNKTQIAWESMQIGVWYVFIFGGHIYFCTFCPNPRQPWTPRSPGGGGGFSCLLISCSSVPVSG